ncbi:MAG: hypothetical protein GX358_11475 [candidate division WS1 bacterium]|jgi:hypothetical protein|nr:hypothetical protein [candidate division WS1 bacterium]
MTADKCDQQQYHPRPDFHRGLIEGQDWLSLDGTWEFRFDPDDVGKEQQWHRSKTEFDRRIRVPFPWESHAAWGTEAAADCDDYMSSQVLLEPDDQQSASSEQPRRQTIGWYRRCFTVPPQWRGRRVVMHVGAADWEIEVWVNGQSLGEVESGYLPVEFDLTDTLVEGENQLTCRVHDPQDVQDRPLGKQHQWYTTCSGIWQPVWLEPRHEKHISSLYLTPDFHNKSVVVDAANVHSLPDAQLEVTVCDQQGQEVARQILEPQEEGRFRGQLRLGNDAVAWSPDCPHLYDVTATLRAGDGVVDTVHSYFGLREVGVGPVCEGGPNYVTVNGKPVYLKGALDQSFNPWGVYTYLSDSELHRHLQQALEAGFNFVRVHVKLENPRYLYWADRLGILLQCDLPNAGYDGWSEAAQRRHEALLRGAIARDYNHPSIISWCVFNETWGLGGDSYRDKPQRQEWVAQMWRLARQLDASRLIEDNSPCLYDHVVTDLNSWHFYLNDYEQASEHIATVVKKTWPGSEFNFVPGYTQDDQPLLNSEYGGISARMGDKDVSWCFKFLTDLLRQHPQICGYIYTELHDIEWERNGIYNYDGSSKEFGYAPADMQADPYFAFDGPPAEIVKPAAELRLPVFIARQSSDSGDPPHVEISLSGIDSLGCTLADLPAGRIEWEPAGEGVQGLVRRGTWIAEHTMPDCECLLRLEARIAGRFADFKYLHVHDGRLAEMERLESGAVVLRKLAGEQEHSTSWHEAELERGLVGQEIHLLGGIEAGHLDYVFELPEGIDLAQAGSVILLAEVSSKMQGARQTEHESWPSHLEVHMNDICVHQVILTDQYADSRGALSHLYGFWGRYGELLRIEVTGEMLQKVAAGATDKLRLRLSVPRAERPGGLIVYSSCAGRYPVDLTLIVEPRDA